MLKWFHNKVIKYTEIHFQKIESHKWKKNIIKISRMVDQCWLANGWMFFHLEQIVTALCTHKVPVVIINVVMFYIVFFFLDLIRFVAFVHSFNHIVDCPRSILGFKNFAFHSSTLISVFYSLSSLPLYCFKKTHR